MQILTAKDGSADIRLTKREKDCLEWAQGISRRVSTNATKTLQEASAVAADSLGTMRVLLAKHETEDDMPLLDAAGKKS